MVYRQLEQNHADHNHHESIKREQSPVLQGWSDVVLAHGDQGRRQQRQSADEEAQERKLDRMKGISGNFQGDFQRADQ
ncbi:hypothetical protein D3C87_1769400 [compost metagenome]